MKKQISTILVTITVVLLTATFWFAEFTATGAGQFPYFQFGCLVVGGLIILSMKHKYEWIYIQEAIGAFALYAVLVALFTSPVIDTIKNIVS
ncbi:MAG: hypothetical protein ABSB79_10170 [Syntrophales bacterium]|jgi:hypothetical protein